MTAERPTTERLREALERIAEMGHALTMTQPATTPPRDPLVPRSAVLAILEEALAAAPVDRDGLQYTPGGLRYPTLDELNGGPVRTDLPMNEGRPPEGDRPAEPTEVSASCRNEDHDASPDCWCRPRVSSEDPVSGERVYVHRAPGADA